MKGDLTVVLKIKCYGRKADAKINYAKKAELNGKVLEKPFITYDELSAAS